MDRIFLIGIASGLSWYEGIGSGLLMLVYFAGMLFWVPPLFRLVVSRPVESVSQMIGAPCTLVWLSVVFEPGVNPSASAQLQLRFLVMILSLVAISIVVGCLGLLAVVYWWLGWTRGL